MSGVFSPRDMLIRAFRDYHAGRDRTQQVEVGPSSIGDCARKVYHLYKRTPATNETDILAALLGVFIHAGIETAIETQDPFGDDFLKELALEHDGLPGHVDLFINSVAMVVDWKTTKKANLAKFPSQQNLYQAHTYAYLLKKAGKQVEKVAIVVIPKDGRLDDIAEHIFDYDEVVALEGLKWLAELQGWAESDRRPPAPERNAKNFCRLYCEFFDPSGEVGCPGK